MKRSCVALVSGGLDSALAAKLMLEQDIEVKGLYLSANWGCCDKEKAISVADELGIPLMVLGVGDAYLDMVRSPKYGYGTAMNPCIDCRIYMFKVAKKYMEEIGAGFVVTGEVMGQRPMSQKSRSLRVIEEDSGLKGLLLRPLSAKLLNPTQPEIEGIVDREKLLKVEGRSRTQQFALAVSKGINQFSAPAGGCLLTDKHFAKKVKDLFKYSEHPTSKEMELLTIGRHFRVDADTKIVLGKNAIENLMLEGYASSGSKCVRPKFVGPTALIVGKQSDAIQEKAISLILQYSKLNKIPGGLLEFWVDGKTLMIARDLSLNLNKRTEMVAQV